MEMDMNKKGELPPRQLRELIRAGEWKIPTTGVATGYVQANLVMLPMEAAFHFLLFCVRNPRPCPILDVLEPGKWEPRIARGADLRTDVPLYRVYVYGGSARGGERGCDPSLQRQNGQLPSWVQFFI